MLEHTACSFTFLTQVATDHGQQAIGTLHVGDKVLAYNPKTHKMEQEPVLHVWVHTDNDLIDLTITTTTRGQHGTPAHTTREVVHTNQKHPFLTIEKGFLPVGQIALGMHVRRADGKIGVITGWKVVPGASTMYNLEVAQDHTFTVGDGQWVVHNCTSVMDARSSNRFNNTMRREIQPTLDRIDRGIRDAHGNDGAVWQNRRGDLPLQSDGYYHEYVHHPSGVMDIPGDISRGGPGALRIIMGLGGEVYFSPYHYGFVLYRLF